ncbi:PQQ-dependent sugar dehydrogenase [Klebsiella pneumoniae]
MATHGINYTLLPIPGSQGKAVEGTEAPHHIWEKSPAISGMAFYDAQRPGLAAQSVYQRAGDAQELIRLQLDGDRINPRERLLGDLPGCASAVTCGRARTAISTCLPPTRRDGRICCAWGWRASLQP